MTDAKTILAYDEDKFDSWFDTAEHQSLYSKSQSAREVAMFQIRKVLYALRAQIRIEPDEFPNCKYCGAGSCNCCPECGRNILILHEEDCSLGFRDGVKPK